MMTDHSETGSPSTAATLLGELSDEELIARSRRDPAASRRCLDVLFERSYPKVAAWCLRTCRDRDTAADVAQEVFFRVQRTLGSFRQESKFSTWLYVVTRSVAINRGLADRRRRETFLDNTETLPEAIESEPSGEERAALSQAGARIRRAMAEDLKELEAKVLHLHCVDGMTLVAITRLLQLTNRSGAKAYLVAAKRKLKRSLGTTLSDFLPAG